MKVNEKSFENAVCSRCGEPLKLEDFTDFGGEIGNEAHFYECDEESK